MPDYAARAGILRVEERQDCVLSDWWTATSCDKDCGTGQRTLRQTIEIPAAGGGTACPDEEALYRVVPCNTQACPRP